MGYRKGDKLVFYVSTTSWLGGTISNYEASKSEFWRKHKETFEEFLHKNPNLEGLSRRMFHVWDGNHRLRA
jgi:hypothetical protein